MPSRLHPQGSLTPIAILCVASFALGAAVAAVLFAHLLRQDREAALHRMQAADQRIALLTQALASQSDAVIDLSISPPAAQIPAADAQAMAAQSAQSARPVPAPPPAARSPEREPIRRTAPAAAQVTGRDVVQGQTPSAPPQAGTSTPSSSRPPAVGTVATVATPEAANQNASAPPAAPAQAQAASPAAQPLQPVSAQMLAQARQRNRIEAVPPSKIGVDSVEGSAVRMLNGSVIGVGQRFPSGERLLSVDPQLREIVTDSRTILLL